MPAGVALITLSDTTVEPEQSTITELAPEAAQADDLARQVYGILGILVDAVDFDAVLRKIQAAAAARTPFLLSTPNLDFLINSQSDPELRESLFNSDLCCADGMPIVWLSRFLGAALKERVAGSDIFEALKNDRCQTAPLKVFLFGGPEGVAATVCERLNAQSHGLVGAGWLYPGIATIESMSAPDIIETINASGADVLSVFLSAKKGQAWLLRNHDRLKIPVRASLGATVNFQAGTVRRAPTIMRWHGLEWLWRIKEEPYLWRRYLRDGYKLFWLFLTRALPLAIVMGRHQAKSAYRSKELNIDLTHDRTSVLLTLRGWATEQNVDTATCHFRRAITMARRVEIDMAGVEIIDCRFTGLLLMLRKQLSKYGQWLAITNVSSQAKRMLRLNGFDFLLNP